MAVRGKRVLLVIAHQRYRDEELELPRKLLLKAGAEVRVASSSLGFASGMQGGRCAPDLLHSAAREADLDALVLIGGDGACEYFDDRGLHRLIGDVVRAGKVVAAICVATSTLANAGVLEGLEVTGYPTREAHLRERGARPTGAAVVTAAGVVTARGPEDAKAFAEALLARLSA